MINLFEHDLRNLFEIDEQAALDFCIEFLKSRKVEIPILSDGEIGIELVIDLVVAEHIFLKRGRE